MKEFRNPASVHEPLAAYSHQIEISGSVRWLVLSGQVGKRSDGHVPEDPIAQLEIALENITHNLHAANMEIKDIVKLTYYLVGDIDTEQRRAATKSWCQGHEPCSTLLYVAGLAAPIYRVEIDVWACAADE